jgi:putative hydrolase
MSLDPSIRSLIMFPLKEKPAIDFHMHTTLTDGTASLEDMVNASIAQNLRAIAITEHVRRDSAWLPRFWAAVENVRAETNGIKIYHGIEAKALDYKGTLDASDEMLERAEIVLGSVHRYPDGEGGVIAWKGLAPERAADIEFRAAQGLASNPRVNVLAHPGGVYEQKFGAFPRDRLEEIVATAARYGVAIEINARYCVDLTALIALCEKHRTAISLGSDAHSPGQVGRIVTRLKEERLWP